MPIIDIPILSMLRTRMQWHQARQEVLAENIANADTPNYRARDLVPPDFSRQLSEVSSVGLAVTNPNHIAGQGGGGDSNFATDADARYEIRPRGNGVSHEDEMMKLGNNQMDYEAVTAMYTHSLGLIKIALDR
ncbi:MAG TPA: flagellar basal body rod protein FlgB [Xanthobacteraceae bacterium]|nr:flagellar basal body rod protein FlgB [Xanthobacteraceae bacterium]